ncbi:MAG: nucleoside-diphosphate-sugar epimerase [Gammaproteobacteria bacterium]
MTKTVLIVGASGLVGTAAALDFADAGWTVITASRRDPELLGSCGFRHVSLDLMDPGACEKAAQSLSAVTHVVYTAVFELPGLIAGWSDPMQIETNGQMLRNLLEPLRESAKLRHVSVLQGTKAYGITAGVPMRVPAREAQERVVHPNFYWLQEDYIRETSAKGGFDFTIFRPQLIVGPNHGVVMNLPPVIGIYAAIRKELGLPFSFPGGATWVWEAADARLVAGAIVWAADAPNAAGETFNLTNGEVFSFRDMWAAMAGTLGVETGPDESISLAEYIPANAHVWQKVVERCDLRAIALDDLLGESHFYADMCLAHGASEPPDPVFVSTVKIRQAGFTMAWNTEDSFCYWLNDLIDRKILPPAN